MDEQKFRVLKMDDNGDRIVWVDKGDCTFDWYGRYGKELKATDLGELYGAGSYIYWAIEEKPYTYVYELTVVARTAWEAAPEDEPVVA